jgi:ribosomal protein L23
VSSSATRVFFPNYRIILLPHGYKPNAMNKTLLFRVPRNISKPQLLDFFTHVHGMKIAKLNTLIQPAKLFRDRQTGKVETVPAYKKAYVTLAQEEMISVPEPIKRRQPEQAPTVDKL